MPKCDRVLSQLLLLFFIACLPLHTHAAIETDKKDPLKMCTNPKWMPFESINQQGQHIGIIADFITLLTAKMQQPLELVKTDNWLQSIAYIQQGRCDILSSATKTTERTQYLNFTQPILEYPIVLATLSDTDFIFDLKPVLNRRFAVIQDYAINESLKLKYPTIKITPVINAELGLAMVATGKVFAYIDSAARIAYQAQKSGILNIKIAGVLGDKYKISIAISKDKPLLLAEFNKLINQLSEQEKLSILNKWLAITYQRVETQGNALINPAGQNLIAGVVLMFFLSCCAWLLYKKKQLTQSVQVLLSEKSEQQQSLVNEQQKVTQSVKFAEMISHEYRTPVTTISTNLDILELRNLKDGLGINPQIIKMRDSVARLIALVETALNREKLFSSKVVLEKANIDFTHIIEQVLTDLSHSHPKRTINIHSPFRKVPFYGDPESLMLLLQNLLENALKYSPKNKPVSLSLDYSPNKLIIEVHDQGIGITHADMEYIFDKYHRAANSGNTLGTGLGLYMAKSVVVQHGGMIDVKCPPEGGTHVRVVFPIDNSMS